MKIGIAALLAFVAIAAVAFGMYSGFIGGNWATGLIAIGIAVVVGLPSGFILRMN